MTYLCCHNDFVCRFYSGILKLMHPSSGNSFAFVGICVSQCVVTAVAFCSDFAQCFLGHVFMVFITSFNQSLVVNNVYLWYFPSFSMGTRPGES